MPKPKILMVDDEEGFLKTMVKRLNKRNFETIGVLSGQKALAIMNETRFDVVILDVKMPGLDGIEALRQIKKKNPDIEVILLTGHASVDSALDGMRLGAYEFLIKPCQIEELTAKIEGVLDLRAIRDEKYNG